MKTYLKILMAVAVAPFLMSWGCTVGCGGVDDPVAYTKVEFENETEYEVFVCPKYYQPDYMSENDFVRVASHGIYITEMSYNPENPEQDYFFITVSSSLDFENAQKSVLKFDCGYLLQRQGKIVFDGFEEEAEL